MTFKANTVYLHNANQTESFGWTFCYLNLLKILTTLILNLILLQVGLYEITDTKTFLLLNRVRVYLLSTMSLLSADCLTFYSVIRYVYEIFSTKLFKATLSVLNITH